MQRYMKTIKFTRSRFSRNSALYFAGYFKYALSKKYNVIIDNNDPDIVLYSNLFTLPTEIDVFTGTFCSFPEDFPNAKKIFATGELAGDYYNYTTQPNNYAMGIPCSVDTPRCLKIQYNSVSTAWFLYHDCHLFDDPFKWMTEPKKYEDIISNKKYFASNVQNSNSVPYRRELFDKLINYQHIRSYGNFATTIDPSEIPTGGSEIKDYTNKVNFFKDTVFSFAIQSACTSGHTHEKMIHSYAANTIPIFWGNVDILDDGFNPESFINCHNYASVDEVIERIKEVYEDKKILKSMLEAPMFVDNKIPEEYSYDYLINFVERILNE